MALFKDVYWDSALIAPKLGMEVDLYHVRTDKTYVVATPRDTQYTPTYAPSEKFAEGVISDVVYKPEHTEGLHPYVNVQTA